MTPDWLKTLVGDTIHYIELKGWKKSRQSHSKDSYSELKNFKGFQHQKIVLKVEFHDDKQKRRAIREVSSLTGIQSIAINTKDSKPTLMGDIDHVTVVARLRIFFATEIISVVTSPFDLNG